MPGSDYRMVTLRFKQYRFRVQVADSFLKMARGLMGRERLDANSGMLFAFNRDGTHGFWMYGMKISIDIIWLDRNRRIVYVWPDAQPCSSLLDCHEVKPTGPARYVVEFKAGTAKRCGMRPGSAFVF